MGTARTELQTRPATEVQHNGVQLRDADGDGGSADDDNHAAAAAASKSTGKAVRFPRAHFAGHRSLMAAPKDGPEWASYHWLFRGDEKVGRRSAVTVLVP